MTLDASGTTPLIRRADVLAAGFSDNDIRRARQSGALTALSPGLYLREADAHDLDPAARHRAVLQEVVPRLAGHPVVSHISAAIMHGLPFGVGEVSGVHVTRAGSAKSRRGPGVRAHRAALAADEIMVVGGLAVTSVARTVLDCALLLPFGDAVLLGDAALHRGQVTPAELDGQLRRRSRVPGVRAAAAVIARAVGGRAVGARAVGGRELTARP